MTIKNSSYISLLWFSYPNFVVFCTSSLCRPYGLSTVHVCVFMCLVAGGRYSYFIIKSTGKIKGSFASTE